MRFVFVLLASAIMFSQPLSAAEQRSTLEQIKQSGKVRIGYRESQPPMSFVDKDGKPVGYSIDLCVRIVNEVKNTLGRDDIAIEYVPVSSTNRFEALSNNTIDILCGATTKTISRGKLVDFTQLTFVTGATLLSLKDNAVDGISGLQGKKVAVSKDTTTIDALKAELKESVSDAKVVPVENANAGMQALIKGEVDAFSADQVVLIGLVLTHEGEEKFAIASDIFSFEPFALAVRRNDSDFRLLADSVLAQLNRSGQITPIYSKWFGQFTKKIPTLLQALYVLNATPE
jgi:ABC-type amino acid transport substrate-binding protein